MGVVAAWDFFMAFGNSEGWVVGVLGFSGLGARVTPSLEVDLWEDEMLVGCDGGREKREEVSGASMEDEVEIETKKKKTHFEKRKERKGKEFLGSGTDGKE